MRRHHDLEHVLCRADDVQEHASPAVREGAGKVLPSVSCRVSFRNRQRLFGRDWANQGDVANCNIPALSPFPVGGGEHTFVPPRQRDTDIPAHGHHIAHPPPISACVTRYFALTSGANVVLLGSLVLAKGAALNTQVGAGGRGQVRG